MAPLSEILTTVAHSSQIDFLSIDAEGMDYEVWKSLKGRWMPKLICIEGKGYKMTGYVELCRMTGNTFYMREDVCPKL